MYSIKFELLVLGNGSNLQIWPHGHLGDISGPQWRAVLLR